MEVKINLEFLKAQNLSPNQFTALYLIHINRSEEFPLNKTIEQLKELGWLKYDGSLNPDKIGSKFFAQQNEPLSEWIKSWLNLWPKNVLPHGYRVSGNTLECKRRMSRFLKDFPEYDKELIFKATMNYLTRQEANGWVYTKKNSKFIFDSETSTLEQECEAILNNSDSNVKSNTVDF